MGHKSKLFYRPPASIPAFKEKANLFCENWKNKTVQSVEVGLQGIDSQTVQGDPSGPSESIYSKPTAHNSGQFWGWQLPKGMGVKKGGHRRNSSSVKSTGCSSREPRFGSQDPCESS